MTELFVSYSRDDAAAIEPIVENLRRLGFNLWIDIEHLKPGTPAWMHAIDEALERVDGVLAFLSPTAKKSEWCTKETVRAKEFEKPIYPILLSGNNRTAVPFHLVGVHYTDMRGRANRKENFEQLIDTLTEDLQHETPAHEVDTDSQGVPVINVVISGHVEGNINPLVIMGDNAGDINVAGNDINIQQQTQTNIQQRDTSLFDGLPDRLRRALTSGDDDTRFYALDRAERLINRREYLNELQTALREMALHDPDTEVRQRAMEVWAKATVPPPQAPERINPEPEPAPAEVEIVEWEPEPEPQYDPRYDILPQPFDWVDIPAGNVDIKGKTYSVEAFQIGKYAISNAQFDVFIEHGYNNEQWWRYSDDAWQWHQSNLQPKSKAFDGQPDHPRVNVSWYEAVAFCLWLSEQTGEQIMLPTEQQWQRAGQGDDGRTYAWGNEDPTDTLANWNRNIGQTTPVDSYDEQARRSPYGLYNMTGNVWEWCRTDYESGAQDIAASAERRVLRGGSWYYSNPQSLRLAYRLNNNPHWRSSYFGFRVARLLASRHAG